MSGFESLVMRRNFLFITVLFAMIIAIFSCKKNNDSGGELFYGKWETSYGDTIIFARENGKDILTFDYSMNPFMPATTKRQYTYSNNKLTIKIPEGYPTTEVFRILNSFSWIQQGQSFSIQGVEWFAFMSSTQTYFTFTKIP